MRSRFGFSSRRPHILILVVPRTKCSVHLTLTLVNLAMCRQNALFARSFFLSDGVSRYNCFMTAKLTKELTAALHATGNRELEVVDPETSRLYFIVDSETHRRAMDALRRQQDREAIAEGLAQMQAGQGRPLDQAFAEMRARLGFSLAK